MQFSYLREKLEGGVGVCPSSSLLAQQVASLVPI